MLRFCWLFLLGALPFTSFSAEVLFTIDAERLDDAAGNAMPTTGMVILGASLANESFSNPTTTAFFSGDDIEIGRWHLDSLFGAGIFQKQISVTLANGLDLNDPLRLFWFPSITDTNVAAPTFGTAFGTYRNDNPEAAGYAPWRVPSGGAVNLGFFTSEATELNNGGNNGPTAGDASFTVVPEPSTYAAAFALGCLGWALAKRRARPSSDNLA